jgi:hypothetical protein
MASLFAAISRWTRSDWSGVISRGVAVAQALAGDDDPLRLQGPVLLGVGLGLVRSHVTHRSSLASHRAWMRGAALDDTHTSRELLAGFVVEIAVVEDLDESIRQVGQKPRQLGLGADASVL